MSDTTDNPTSPDPAAGVDELLATIRDALTDNVSTDIRSAGALACRAILGVLDPASRASIPPSTPSPPTSPPLTSPFASLLSVIGPSSAAASGTGSIPREQLLALLAGGLRSLLARTEPAYRTPPAQTPPRPSEGKP
jgi:hypothetical protein